MATARTFKEIFIKFNLKAQVRHIASKDVLLDVREKFTTPYINLTHSEVEDPDGNRLPVFYQPRYGLSVRGADPQIL